MPKSPLTLVPLVALTLVLVSGGCATVPTSAADPARELIELNRQLMQTQIVDRDAAFFREIALEQFLVVAPGGRVEDLEQSAAGVVAFDARGIEVDQERVTFADDTAVLVGRLRIDGEMKPVGVLPPMKFMAVFVGSPGRWRLLARSLTPCFEMAVSSGFC